MPITFRSDQKPVVELDPRLEISPFVLFRRLRDGNSPALIDVRLRPGRWTLQSASHRPDPNWRPLDDGEVVLFDDDGITAVERTRELQRLGFEKVRALFGGLDLYRFSLDPDVVGGETYLLAIDAAGDSVTNDEHRS